MIPTPQQQHEDELILQLSERELIALDAFLFNPSNKINAYKVAKGITSLDIDNETLNTRATKWLNNKSCKAYVNRNKEIINIGIESQKERGKQLDSQQLTKTDLVNILESIIKTTQDSAKKAEYIIKLADLQGFRKDQSTKEEKKVRFYLPLNCTKCPFLSK